MELSTDSLKNLCRDEKCLHIEEEMAAYMLQRTQAGEELFPVIGCDARTGVPMRMIVGIQDIQ